MQEFEPEEEGWNALDTPEQIEAAMKAFGNFHDGCVREIHVATSHYVDPKLSMHFDARPEVRMLVQRQFSSPSAIELRFAEIVELNVAFPDENYVAIIFSAGLFIEDGIVYWAEDGGWKPGTPRSQDSTWIAARRAWWRDASAWMGPDLRYRRESQP